MEPRTVEQKKLAQWVQAMPELTERQLAYGIKHCFNNNVVLESRGWLWCVSTNQVWHEPAKDVKLYSRILRPQTNYKKMDVLHGTSKRNRTHFVILTTKEGYQIARWFCIDRILYMGKVKEQPKASYVAMPVGVEFVAPNGKRITFERNRCTMCWEKDRWSYWDDTLHLRRSSVFAKYFDSNAVLVLSITKKLRRNGWDKKLMDEKFSTCAVEFCQGLLKWPLFEQCVKTGHYAVCWDLMAQERGRMMGQCRVVGLNDSLLTAIKLANRHHVQFGDYDKWRDFKDYMDDLLYLGKDIHNPSILFPVDFQKAHREVGHIAQKRRQETARQRERQLNLERLREKAETDKKVQAWVNEYSQRFADMDIRKAEFEVKPLVTKEDFVAEADHMHHCIVTYYGRPNTLLLSIAHNGQKAETAEVNLIGRGNIVQCRGQYNHPSKWHDEIVGLLEANLTEFIKRGQRKMQPATLPVLATHYKMA